MKKFSSLLSKTVLLLTFILVSNQRLLADVDAFHGMALFGKDKVYASHLPMLHSPHDYQVLFEVDLQPGVTGYQEYMEYQEDGSTLLTIAPKENFDLTKLIDGEIEQFDADLYLGHFEKANAVLLGTISVKVKNLLYSKKIELVEPGPARAFLQEYFVFGSGEEIYALNLVGFHSKFDSILKVSEPTTVHFINPFLNCGRGGCDPIQGEEVALELPAKLRMATLITELQEESIGNLTVGKSSILKVLLNDSLHSM